MSTVTVVKRFIVVAPNVLKEMYFSFFSTKFVLFLFNIFFLLMLLAWFKPRILEIWGEHSTIVLPTQLFCHISFLLPLAGFEPSIFGFCVKCLPLCHQGTTIFLNLSFYHFSTPCVSGTIRTLKIRFMTPMYYRFALPWRNHFGIWTFVFGIISWVFCHCVTTIGCFSNLS